MEETQREKKTKRTEVRRRRREMAILLTAAAGLLLLATAVYGLRGMGGERPTQPAGFTKPSADTDDNAGQGHIATEETGWRYTGWKYAVMGPEALTQGTLILVGRSAPYDADSAPGLVRVFDHKTSSYFVRDTDVYAAESIMEPLNRLLDDFEAESGLRTVNVVAGWRSREYQEKLYEKEVREKGSDHAASYLAKPGESEHHTGLAVDLSLYYEDSGLSGDFDGKGAYAWINDNAWRYGFVQRYPAGKEAITGISNEPWHYRYVGPPHAQMMEENGMCLEEYLEWLKSYPFDGAHLFTECLGQAYEIYYCAGGDVYVPMDGEADVSGNNSDGFVVTIPRRSGDGVEP